MKSKKEVKALIENIKKATGLTQQQVAVQAGYRPNTLSQQLSKGERLDAMHKQLEIAFSDKLNKSTLAEGPAQYNKTSAQTQMSLAHEQAITALLTKHNDQLFALAMQKDEIVKIKTGITGIETAKTAILKDLDSLREDMRLMAEKMEQTLPLRLKVVLQDFFGANPPPPDIHHNKKPAPKGGATSTGNT